MCRELCAVKVRCVRLLKVKERCRNLRTSKHPSRPFALPTTSSDFPDTISISHIAIVPLILNIATMPIQSSSNTEPEPEQTSYTVSDVDTIADEKFPY